MIVPKKAVDKGERGRKGKGRKAVWIHRERYGKRK